MDNHLFWADRTAKDVVLQWDTRMHRTEMGMGASGIPHVGSVGDAVRSYAVSLGITALGKKSELIAFSDDRDGLRKVPAGFPASLDKEIGKPVSTIPDPFGCHASFAAHITSILKDGLEKLGICFTLRRGNDEYSGGTLDREIITILSNAKKAGEIIQRITGSEKFLNQLPFLPICRACGRIYTTRATGFDQNNRTVSYVCDHEFEGRAAGRKISVGGCGSSGEVGIREGKLAWKVEFAARWHALDIHYEAFGKDILDSVRCNDAISREIFNREPPIHSFYELFTERGGKKISKSRGNVFTPQRWLEFASPASLRLLFLKRLGAARVVDIDTIPGLMEEVDELERLYFKKNGGNSRERAHKRRLFEYVHLLKPPAKQGLQIPYSTLISLARSLPVEGRVELMCKVLNNSGMLKSGTHEKELEKRIQYAAAWVGGEKPEPIALLLSKTEKKALSELHEYLKKPRTAEELQTAIFRIAKTRGIRPHAMFRILYTIMIGMEQGPRAGSLITMLGQERVRNLISARL